MGGDYSQKNIVCVPKEKGEEDCAKGEEIGVAALRETFGFCDVNCI